MSFLKLNSLARKSAVALLAVAGVLLFAGGAWAEDPLPSVTREDLDETGLTAVATAIAALQATNPTPTTLSESLLEALEGAVEAVNLPSPDDSLEVTSSLEADGLTWPEAGVYNVIAVIAANDDFGATDLILGTITIVEDPGLTLNDFAAAKKTALTNAITAISGKSVTTANATLKAAVITAVEGLVLTAELLAAGKKTGTITGSIEAEDLTWGTDAGVYDVIATVASSGTVGFKAGKVKVGEITIGEDPELTLDDFAVAKKTALATAITAISGKSVTTANATLKAAVITAVQDLTLTEALLAAAKTIGTITGSIEAEDLTWGTNTGVYDVIATVASSGTVGFKAGKVKVGEITIVEDPEIDVSDFSSTSLATLATKIADINGKTSSFSTLSTLRNAVTTAVAALALTAENTTAGKALGTITGAIEKEGLTWPAAGTYDVIASVAKASTVGFKVEGIKLIVGSVTINADPTIVTYFLPNGVAGVAYSQQLVAANFSDQSAVVWDVSSGTLPTGLELSTSGLLNGTPSAAKISTSYTFRARVTATGESVTKAISFAILGDAPAFITPAAISGLSAPLVGATAQAAVDAGLTAPANVAKASLLGWKLPSGADFTGKFVAGVQYTAVVSLKANGTTYAFNTTWGVTNVNAFKPAGVTGDVKIDTLNQQTLVFRITYPATLAEPTITISQTGIELDKIQTVRNVAWNVTYTLSGTHKFADQATITANKSAFAVTGLPTGVTDSAITRVSDNVVTVYYRGKPTASGATGTLEFKTSIARPNVVTAGGGTPPVEIVNRLTAVSTQYTVKQYITIPGSYIVVDNAAATYQIGTVRKVTPSIQSSFTSALTGDGGTLYYQVTYKTGSHGGTVVSGPTAADTGTVNIGVTNAGTYYVTVRAFNRYNEGTRQVTFVVNKRDLSNITLTATTAGTLTYDGTSKEDNVAVVAKDGATVLEEGVDWEGTTGTLTKTAFKDPVSAGASVVEIQGLGNYTGKKSTTFNINKQRIYVDTVAMPTITKAYNGVSAWDTTGLTLANFIKFTKEQGASVPPTFDPIVTGTVTEAPFTVVGNFVNSSGTNVSDSATATRVKLTVTINNKANFTLSSSATSTNGGSADVYKSAKITRATPDTQHFTYAKPSSFTHAYTGNARGIGEVTLKAPYTGMGRFRVLYGSDTTKPKNVGTYAVSVVVDTIGPNFTTGTVNLGEYTISEPAKPVIADTWITDVTVREGVPLTLTVDATAPASGGNLSYQWYKDGVAVANNGKNKTLSVNGLLQGETYVYKVEVKNTKSAGTAGSEVGIEERSVTVTVIEPPINISGATVSVIGSYTYTGSAIEPPVDSIVVFIPPTADADTVKLIRGTDYTVSFAKNVNVGTATVSITGKDVYIGIRTASFPIVKKKPDFTDVTWKGEVEYNGKAQPITVTAAVGTGLGDVAVKYDGKAEAPTDAGLYVITADFAGGTNYAAATAVPLGFYTINPKKATKDDLVYTVWPAQILVDSAKADGIGAVTLKPNTGDATITVLYAGSVDVPLDAGSYPVLVQISNADNFTDDVVELGTYLIVEEYISVAQSGREVPNKVVVEEASVAPIKAFSASFTAGPSPVAKASGEIKFFSTKSVKGGSLYVFDANGNAVAKVAAKQGSGKEVGSWNLKNNRGATVAEGTYVVKGALVGKDGTKEKVSFVFSVK